MLFIHFIVRMYFVQQDKNEMFIDIVTNVKWNKKLSYNVDSCKYILYLNLKIIVEMKTETITIIMLG